MTHGATAVAERIDTRAPSVTLTGVSKRHGAGETSVVALQDIALTVGAGEFVCLVGASGCGKTTLLNLVAGLDRPSMGTVDVTVAGSSGNGATPGGPSAGRTGGTATAMLFQDSALFPWLTVAANVELPLRLRGL